MIDRAKIKALCATFEAQAGIPVCKLENLDALADGEIMQALRDDMGLCRDQINDACNRLEVAVWKLLEDGQ